ncbi:MAG: DUF169 domain-containing protein [Clostridia bacterium]|nr:DUF169 domain-containing protein [Clostridia bacterium]
MVSCGKVKFARYRHCVVVWNSGKFHCAGGIYCCGFRVKGKARFFGRDYRSAHIVHYVPFTVRSFSYWVFFPCVYVVNNAV